MMKLIYYLRRKPELSVESSSSTGPRSTPHSSLNGQICSGSSNFIDLAQSTLWIAPENVVVA
jgi:hypothetical protein